VSRGYVIETGRTQTHGPSDELLEDESNRAAYLGSR
jgi:ABC-type branched-subunit amino acid transport system ATPase component